MVEVMRQLGEHFYAFDLILDRTVAQPAEARREMEMASDDQPAPRRKQRQRRRTSMLSGRSHGALAPDMRVLYRHFLESGMPLSRYAREWIGVSRQTAWSWFQGLSYPYPSVRAQIKARTGIEIGQRPPDVEREVSRAIASNSQAQERIARSRHNTANARANNQRIRADNDKSRRVIDRLNNGRKGEP